MSLIKFLLFGLLALFVLLPAAGILMLIGLPVIAVLAVVGLRILGLLMVVGLPIFIVFVVCAVALGLVFGLLGLVVGLGIAALKIAFFIALPIFFIAWLAGGVAGRFSSTVEQFGWAIMATSSVLWCAAVFSLRYLLRRSH